MYIEWKNENDNDDGSMSAIGVVVSARVCATVIMDMQHECEVREGVTIK